MKTQADYWSKAAGVYEEEFVDPYRPDVDNPLLKRLQAIPKSRKLAVGDLGCGIGPLLPTLAKRFRQVHAVDFAAGMLARARERAAEHKNITYHQVPFTDLAPLHGKFDVAVAVNSLILPDIPDLEQALSEIRQCLRPGGRLLAIVPSIDAVHYLTMLLLDRARTNGLPADAARKNAAHHADHVHFDFAWGEFRYQGLHQHFWQPFEISYRLRRTGFRLVRRSRVHLAWAQMASGSELQGFPAPWDWFFEAVPRTERK